MAMSKSEFEKLISKRRTDYAQKNLGMKLKIDTKKAWAIHDERFNQRQKLETSCPVPNRNGSFLSAGENMNKIGERTIKANWKQVCHGLSPRINKEVSFVQRKTFPYSGQYRSYPKFENIVYAPCYGRIIGKNLWFCVKTNGCGQPIFRSGKDTGKKTKALVTGKFICPKGYAVLSNNIGIYLKKLNDKYESDLHLTSDDVLAGPMASVRKLLKYREERISILNERKKHEQERRAVELQSLKNKKRMERLKKYSENDVSNVTFNDALKSGNCFPGVNEFCKRHGLLTPDENPCFSIPSDKLIRLAKNDYEKERIKNSIFTAYLRETTVMI